MKTTGVLVLGILVVLCFGLLWAYNGPGKNVPEPQDQGQVLVNALRTSNHQIDWATASILIANQKAKLSPSLSANARVARGTRGGTFARSAVDQILAQPGVVGLRYYFAQNTDASPTIVLVGVNTQGLAMTNAAVMELAVPCPPMCND